MSMLTPRGASARGRSSRDSSLLLPMIAAFVLAAGMVAWLLAKDPLSSALPQNSADCTVAADSPDRFTSPTPKRAATTRSKASATPTASLLAPGLVQVNVFNSTPKSGLAKTVADDLRERGFRVGEVDNDPKGEVVKDIAQIRYGTKGKAFAQTMAAYVPGAALVKDKRTDTSVDLALGPKFSSISEPGTQPQADAEVRTQNDEVAAAPKPAPTLC